MVDSSSSTVDAGEAESRNRDNVSANSEPAGGCHYRIGVVIGVAFSLCAMRHGRGWRVSGFNCDSSKRSISLERTCGVGVVA